MPFRQLLFSNDGNQLIAVADATAYVLDAFKGELQHTVRLGTPEGQQTAPVCACLRAGWWCVCVLCVFLCVHGWLVRAIVCVVFPSVSWLVGCLLHGLFVCRCLRFGCIPRGAAAFRLAGDAGGTTDLTGVFSGMRVHAVSYLRAHTRARVLGWSYSNACVCARWLLVRIHVRARSCAGVCT